jgi:hypothetical protein
MEELLKEIYYDPKQGFIGAKALYLKAVQRDPTITKSFVKQWLIDEPVNQVHREITTKKNYLPIYSNRSGSFQIDLSFIPKFKKINKGYWIMFTAVNINTRVGYAYKMQSKTDIYEVIARFIKDANPQIITSDNGSEFINSRVQNMFKDADIETHLVQAGDKHIVGKVERFNRTIKERLNRIFTKISRPVWYNILDDVILNYNNTVHSSIKQTPFSVTAEDEQRIIAEEQLKTQSILNTRRLIQAGDYIRIPIKKKVFAKGEPRFSNTVYIVKEVNSTGNAIQVIGRKEKYNHEDILIVKKPDDEPIDDSVKKQVEKDHRVNRKLKQAGIDNANRKVGTRVQKPVDRLNL